MNSFKAKIQSLQFENENWTSYFKTQEEAQSWVDWNMSFEGRRAARTEVKPLLDENGNEQFNEDGNLITQEVSYEAEATFEITDITEQIQRKEKIKTLETIPSNQSQVRNLCFKIIDLMGKKNTDKNLTHEQKDQLMSDSSIIAIMQMLQAGRPAKAKMLIENYTPDETLVTTEDKNEIIELLDAILTEYF